MSEDRCCSELSVQIWPTNGSLKKNMNKTLSKLKNAIKNESAFVEAYKVSSVKVSQNKKSFIQTGCGPNFEGDLLSQCTCRHDIRQKHTCNEWKNNWIAGITGKLSICGKSEDTYLFYLMKVDRAFCSFKQLWNYYNEDNPSLIDAKQTTTNVLGDLYIPRNDDIDDEWKVENYINSTRKHLHFKYFNKLKDINYPEWRKQRAKKKGKKLYRVNHAKLLLGNVDRSYVWRFPKIRALGWHKTRAASYTIEEFLKILEPVNLS